MMLDSCSASSSLHSTSPGFTSDLQIQPSVVRLKDLLYSWALQLFNTHLDYIEDECQLATRMWDKETGAIKLVPLQPELNIIYNEAELEAANYQPSFRLCFIIS